MKTIRINRHRITKKALTEAVSVLRAGGVVLFPTETAYGLAADPANPEAIRKVYRIKEREDSKQLPLVASSHVQAVANFKLNKAILRLTEKHWPGPLTVILPTRKKSPIQIRPDAAVRVPGAIWPRALAEALGRPVTATSANRTGEPNCYSAKDAVRSLCPGSVMPDLVLDAGRLPERLPSTIVRFEKNQAVILRQGTVRVE